jgi:hypothetical protein
VCCVHLQAQLSYPASKLDMLAASQLLLDALVPSPFLKQQALALEGLALVTDALGPELPPLLRQAGATEVQISHVLQYTAQLQRPQLHADGSVLHNNAVELAAAAASGDPTIKSFSTGGLLGSGGSAAFARSRSGRSLGGSSMGGVNPGDLSLSKFAALQLAGRSSQQQSSSNDESPRAAPAAGAASLAPGSLGGCSLAGAGSLNASLSLGGKGTSSGSYDPCCLGGGVALGRELSNPPAAGGAGAASCGGALGSARSAGRDSPASPASRLIWTVPPAAGDKAASSANYNQQQQQQLEQLLPPASRDALAAHAQLIHVHGGSMSAGGIPPQQHAGHAAAAFRSSSMPGRYVLGKHSCMGKAAVHNCVRLPCTPPACAVACLPCTSCCCAAGELCARRLFFYAPHMSGCTSL